MRTKHVTALALAGAFSVTPASVHTPQAAPDQTLGMALLSATVSADGTLVRGAGAASAVRNISAGTYTVTFDRDVSTCSCTASLGANAANSGTVLPGGIIASCPRPTPNTVDVLTTFGGNSSDLPFHLIVFCPR